MRGRFSKRSYTGRTCRCVKTRDRELRPLASGVLARGAVAGFLSKQNGNTMLLCPLSPLNPK